MPLYSDFGDVLVRDDELLKMQQDHPDRVQGFFDKSSSVNALEFSTGRLKYETWQQAVSVIPFEPIGLNKPLTITVREVYTGKNPRQGTRDMLLTSAVKGMTSQLPAPRAVNFLAKQVRRETAMRGVPATGLGTTLLYYSPAQTESLLTMTLEFGFDSILDDLFDLLTTVFTAAAAIPVFLTQQYTLLALGGVAKLSAGVAKKFGQKVDFAETVQFNFNLPGRAAEAKSHLIVNDDFPLEEVKRLQINDEGRCVYKDGQPYRGDHPYVVIALDGAQRDDFRDFSAVYASAALLEQFYGIPEGNLNPLGPVMDALKLYNDLEWRRRADALSQNLADLEEGSKEFQDKQEAYDAAVANILDALLKP